MYRERLPSWLKHLDFMLLDILALLMAFLLAFYLRIGDGSAIISYRNFVGVMVLVQIAVSVCNQSYKGILRRGYYMELVRCVQHVAVIMLITVLYLFFAKIAEETSRLMLAYTTVFYVAFTYCLRIAWKWVIKKSRFTFGRRSLLIITEGDLAAGVIQKITRETDTSYQIAAICLLDDAAPEIGKIPVLTGVGKAIAYLRKHWVDEVLIVLSEGHMLEEKFQQAISSMGLTVHIAMADKAQLMGKSQVVENFGDYTVVTSSFNVVSPISMLVKRLMDIVGGLLGCLVTLLLTIFIGPIIYIQSPGPIFFSQERVGMNGKKFKMYKFRSMNPDAEEQKKDLLEDNQVKDGMMFKMEWDPRIIGSKTLPDGTHKKGICNFIRDTSLDEFPQFFNVLKGDMSLVGTRPPTVDEWEKYKLHHHARLSTKPGITGLWQVSGRSKITDFEKVVQLDTQYIRRWNLGLDLKILAKTVKVVFTRDGSM